MRTTTLRIAVAVTLLCGGALGAWASGETDAAAAELPLVEFVNDFAYDGVAQTRLAEIWGELTGTNFVPINIPRSDYDAKMATFLASGDVPEIASVLDETLTNAVDQFKGALFVDTLAEIDAGAMPGLGALVDEIAGILQYAGDGRVYTQPFVNMGLRAANSNILLRTDLLANAGYDVETLDDVARTPGGLFELFRASHLAMNGGSEPILTNRRGIGPRGWIVSPIALQFGTYNRIYFNEDNRYEYGPTMDRFLVTIDFIRQLHASGILFPTWATMREEDQKRIWLEEERAGAFIGSMHGSWIGWYNNGQRPAYQDAGDFHVMPPVIFGTRGRIRTPSRSSGAFVISATSDNKDAAVRASDWAYTDEGANLLRFGEEGVAHAADDNSPWGGIWLMNLVGWPEDVRQADPDGARATEYGFGRLWRTSPRIMWGKSDLLVYRDHTLPTYTGEFIDAIWIDKLRAFGAWNDTPEPKFPFTADELDERIQLEGVLSTLVDENVVKFTHGQRPISEWGQFQQQLVNAGAERLVEIYNTALDRFLEQTGTKL